MLVCVPVCIHTCAWVEVYVYVHTHAYVFMLRCAVCVCARMCRVHCEHMHMVLNLSFKLSIMLYRMKFLLSKHCLSKHFLYFVNFYSILQDLNYLVKPLTH